VVSTKPENRALFVYLKPRLLNFRGQSKKTVPLETVAEPRSKAYVIDFSVMATLFEV